MKQNKILAISLLGLSAAGVSALAGEPAPSGGPDWCRLLTDDLGSPIYSNDDAMLIQAVKFFGRAQVQFASTDIDGVNGVDDSETFDEFRRLRFGTQVQLLKHFKIKANANFVKDGRPKGGSRDFGYQSLDVALLSFDAGALLGGGAFDGVNVSVGRHKLTMSNEVHTSSKKIKTVERSAVANKVYHYAARLSGITLEKSKDNFSGTLGVFSTEDTPELSGETDGLAFYANGSWELQSGGSLIADFLYNDAHGTPDNEVGLYEWAVALAYVTEKNGWDILLQGTLGENGDDGAGERGGNFWGLVAMASRNLTDKIEAVVRYSYQGADEAEGIATNSRYLRRNHDADVGGGRGDQHHSIYAGLNYYACGHNAKIMTGIELETLDTAGGDVDALTLWLALRTYF